MVVKMFKYSASSKEEIFTQNFLEILKHPLQNFLKNIESMFPLVMSSAHNGALPVAKWLKKCYFPDYVYMCTSNI